MTCIVPAPIPAAIVLADTMPLAEAGSARPGSMNAAPRADHQHPRLTSAQPGQLDGAGHATIVFRRTFDVEPAMSVLAVENDTKSPPEFKVKQFLDDTGQPWTTGKVYGGAIIYGSRARALPMLNATTDLLAGVAAKLTGYAPTEPAAFVRFSLIALQQSPPPT